MSSRLRTAELELLRSYPQYDEFTFRLTPTSTSSVKFDITYEGGVFKDAKTFWEGGAFNFDSVDAVSTLANAFLELHDHLQNNPTYDGGTL